MRCCIAFAAPAEPTSRPSHSSDARYATAWRKRAQMPAPQPADLPGAGTNGPTEVFTLAEAATYLRLSEPEIVRLVHAQNLPGRCTGSDWRFLKSAIQQWLMAGSPRQARKEAQLALA